MQKKDKEKVFGGEWSEAQLREFLVAESYDGSDEDYVVIRAYRHTVPVLLQILLTVCVKVTTWMQKIDGVTCLRPSTLMLRAKSTQKLSVLQPDFRF